MGNGPIGRANLKEKDTLPMKRRDFMKGAAALPVAGAVVGTTSLAPGTVKQAAATALPEAVAGAARSRESVHRECQACLLD